MSQQDAHALVRDGAVAQPDVAQRGLFRVPENLNEPVIDVLATVLLVA